MGLRSVPHAPSQPDAPQTDMDLPVSRRDAAAATAAGPSPTPIHRADGPAASPQSALFPTPGSKIGLVPAPSQSPFTAPVLPTEEKRRRLVAMEEKEVRGCVRCRLSERRTHTVFGEGDPDAAVMFIGEGPGETEDQTGRPFVGRAGEMLNKWIAAMGLRREQVFIANIVKCLRYSTLVQLENGSWERIGRLVRQKYAGRVMSVLNDGTIGPRRVTGWHASPLAGRRVLKLSYASSALRGGNRAVTWLTHDHEVMTRRGWVRAEELTSDDEMAVGQGLSRVAHDVVIGSLLGDGTMSRKNAHLGIVHCRDQRQYVQLKASALSELCPIVYDSSVVIKRLAREYLTTRCRTKASRALRILQNSFYDGRRKRVPRNLKLTPLALAIWFMDDGYTRHRQGKKPLAEIAANSFEPDEVRFLTQCLRRDLGLEGYIRKSSAGRIHFDVSNTRRLSQIVAPYCPPCLRYKLQPEAEKMMPFDPSLYKAGPAQTLYDRVMIQDTNFGGNDRTFYCIDVEETQNFVTSGGVVHNCRPPGNREPAPDEVATCTPYLERQIEIIRPKVIVTLGRPAAQHMLQAKITMNKTRGAWQNWRGIRLMPTFHPAYVLRQYTPQTRAAVWSDLQMVMRELGLPMPKKSS